MCQTNHITKKTRLQTSLMWGQREMLTPITMQNGCSHQRNDHKMSQQNN